MYEKTITQLKKLRSIEPSPAFRARSRIQLFSEMEKRRPFSFLTNPVLVGVFTVIFIMVAAFSFFSFVRREPRISLLNSEEINIELQKIEYRKGDAETIVVEERISDPSIDELLDKVIF